MILEAEPNLRVDATVVSRIPDAETTESRRRRGLSKQRRTEVADGIAEVRVFQNVLEVQRERQIVTTTTATTWSTETTATAAWSTTKTTTAATTRTPGTSPGHPATHYRAISLSITLLILLPVLILILTIVGVRAPFRAKTPRLAHAQVGSDRSWTFREVTRNHDIARRKREFEVSERRA